jgi:hypothetical protein
MAPRSSSSPDFHCGYCKKLSGELKAIGARVEERPISIFGPESRKDAERVLCSPFPETSLHAAYAGHRARQSQALRHAPGWTPTKPSPRRTALPERP